ncbi:protein TolQ [bacterium]|nr:protein TolQ [bacterium]
MLQNGVFDLISQSGPVAKLVLLVLLLASVLSWALIFSKLRVLKKAAWENTEFLNVFWNSRSMDEVLIKSERFERSPVARIFKNGARELKKINDSSQSDPRSMDNVGRALSRSANSEIADLERNVSWLATTASATPFIGLFGTVWGIMNSFQSIGASGAANLAVVAPGISEALITTAMGIAAAVPAVIAYNHILVKIKRISIDMDCFAQDFLNIVNRRVPAQAGTSGRAGI